MSINLFIECGETHALQCMCRGQGTTQGSKAGQNFLYNQLCSLLGVNCGEWVKGMCVVTWYRWVDVGHVVVEVDGCGVT